jgi:hypothetical protein
MVRSRCTLLIIMLVLSGLWTTTIVSDDAVVRADQLGTPNDMINQTYRLLGNISIMLKGINTTRINATYDLFNWATKNGTIDLRMILYGLIDKNNKYLLQDGVLGGPLGNSSFANIAQLLQSNDTILGKLNRIIQIIAGNNTQTDWNLYDLNNAILYGLIDKDNKYILQNGTLSHPRGNSAILVSLQNDLVLAGLIKDSKDTTTNATQHIITVSDDNRNKINDNLKTVNNNILGNIGTLQWIVIILLVILVFFVFHQIFLRQKFARFDRSLKEPACFGDPRIFSPDKECAACRLKEDCERQIIAATANMQQQEEAPKKKKRFLHRREQADEEEQPRQGCFGQYLAGDPECVKCMDARQCMNDTPGLKQPEREVQPMPTKSPAATAFNQIDPLAGM